MLGITPAAKKQLSVVGVVGFTISAYGAFTYTMFSGGGGLVACMALLILTSVLFVRVSAVGIRRWVLIVFMIVCSVIGVAVGWGVALILH
jgi:hypothetical protein